MSTFLRILFLAVAIVATTSPAVQAQQQTLPSMDIHVYLDVSGTIFTGQSDGPNFKIVEMLRSLFDAPIEGGRTFTGPNDSIHLNTFGLEVKPFGSAIDGGSKAARDKLLDDFAKSRKPGKDVPPQQAPDQQTRFDSLLDSIRRTIETRSSGAERLKVIIIASDFVHDASGESKKFCNEVMAKSLPANVRKEIPALRGVVKETTSGGQSPFMLMLSVDTAKLNTGKDYGRCFDEAMQQKLILGELKNSVGAEEIQYSSVQNDTPKFVSEFVEKLYKATLPHLGIEKGEAELVNEGLKVRLALRNDGGTGNKLFKVLLFERESGGVPLANQSSIPPEVLDRRQTRTIEFILTGREAAAVNKLSVLHVEFEDESVLPWPDDRRRFPITVKETKGLRVERVERNPDAPEKLAISVRNAEGAEKAPTWVAFYHADQVGAFIDRVRVSGQSGSLVPSASTTLDIVMPENVRARMAQERFWLSVDAGRTGDLTSNRFEVPPAGIKELEITSLGEWMAETGDRIRLTLPVRNPNTIPVKASRITLLSGNLPVGGCDTGVTLQSGSTPSPLACVMSTRESRGAFDLPNLSVRLEQADGRPLSRVSELKPLPRHPLIIESSTVDAAAKPPQIRVTVRNNGDVYTLLKGAKIANSGQEEGIEWTPQGGPIVVAARSALVLQPIPVSVEDQRKVLLDQQTTMVLNDLGSGTSPLTANLTPLQTSPIEVGSDSRWNEETGELEMILRNRGPIVQTPQGVELILGQGNAAPIILPISPARPIPGGESATVRLDVSSFRQAEMAGNPDLFACVLKTVDDRERGACANRVGIKPLRGPDILVKPRIDRDIAYDQNARTVFVSLENTSRWAGKARGIRLLPANSGDKLQFFPFSAPVTVQAGQSDAKAEIKMSLEDWKTYFSPIGTRMGEYAVTGDGQAESSKERNQSFLPTKMERIELTTSGSWIQKLPGRNDIITVRANVSVTRPTASAFIPQFVKIDIFDAEGRSIQNKPAEFALPAFKTGLNDHQIVIDAVKNSEGKTSLFIEAYLGDAVKSERVQISNIRFGWLIWSLCAVSILAGLIAAISIFVLSNNKLRGTYCGSVLPLFNLRYVMASKNKELWSLITKNFEKAHGASAFIFPLVSPIQIFDYNIIQTVIIFILIFPLFYVATYKYLIVKKSEGIIESLRLKQSDTFQDIIEEGRYTRMLISLTVAVLMSSFIAYFIIPLNAPISMFWL